MASRINPEPTAEVNENVELEPVKAADDRDARIAELEARLKAAEQKAEGYRAGNDYQVVQHAIQEALDAGLDPWTVKVSVRVPERRDTTEKSYWIMVNGRSVQIPADNKYQEMALPFAEQLINQLQADRYAQHFAENDIQVYDPITNPHPNK